MHAPSTVSLLNLQAPPIRQSITMEAQPASSAFLTPKYSMWNITTFGKVTVVNNRFQAQQEHNEHSKRHFTVMKAIANHVKMCLGSQMMASMVD